MWRPRARLERVSLPNMKTMIVLSLCPRSISASVAVLKKRRLWPVSKDYNKLSKQA